MREKVLYIENAGAERFSHQRAVFQNINIINKFIKLVMAFIENFLTGISFFFDIKYKKRRIIRFNKIKDNLDKGLVIDKESLNNDRCPDKI